MKQNELLLIVISCFVLVLIWVGFNLYHAHADSTITETQSIQVAPITPEFNKGAIEALKTRTKVDPLFESSKPPVASSTPELSPTKAPTTKWTAATPAPTLKVTP